MPEIVPNWHPLLVHFPIALIAVAVVFAPAAKLAGNRPIAVQLAVIGSYKRNRILRVSPRTCMMATHMAITVSDAGR